MDLEHETEVAEPEIEEHGSAVAEEDGEETEGIDAGAEEAVEETL
ncbi:MAG: hypothetical protein ABSC56_12355 [Solirubrobacteraceae bacterium]|jgi:hypothetical protein